MEWEIPFSDEGVVVLTNHGDHDFSGYCELLRLRAMRATRTPMPASAVREPV